MSEPITWLALEQIRDAVKLIQVSRGYRTDLGLGAVVLEGDQLPESDQAHTIIVGTDVAIDDDGSAVTVLKSAMDVVIEFSIPFETTQDAQLLAHRARADILRALTGLRRRLRELPPAITKLAVIGSRIGQPEEGAATVIAQVTARAALSESFTPANP